MTTEEKALNDRNPFLKKVELGRKYLARFGFICSSCGKAVQVGDPVWWVPKFKDICFECHEKGIKNSLRTSRRGWMATRWRKKCPVCGRIVEVGGRLYRHAGHIAVCGLCAEEHKYGSLNMHRLKQINEALEVQNYILEKDYKRCGKRLGGVLVSQHSRDARNNWKG